MTKAGESNEAEEEEDEGGKKEGNFSAEKKIVIEMILSPYYHSSPILLVHEYPQTAISMTLSSAGRMIYWSTREKKQI